MAGVDTQEWQGRVGESWAAEWQRTDRSFSELTAELLRRIAALKFTSVLDVGCGAGELSLSVAGMRPSAQVLGVDISPDLIATALERSAGIPNVSFTLADAAVWHPKDSFAPDLVMSRHGVMFFGEPAAAFANLHDVSAPGARMIFSCFRPVQENPFFSEVGRLVPPSGETPDPLAPGPFAFADAVRVKDILGKAGWSSISMEPFDFRMIAGSGKDPVSEAVAYFLRIGPAARAIAEMDDSARESFKQILREFSQKHLRDGVVGLGAAVWIVSGMRK